MKAAPCDSLAFRLALAVFFVYEKFGGVLAVAYLWQEVILELRYRWENGFSIVGVEGDIPNHGTCLLHQKLQMLKCCIVKRQLAISPVEAFGPNRVLSSTSIYQDTQSDVMTDDEDEFFDCENDAEDQTRNNYVRQGNNENEFIYFISLNFSPYCTKMKREYYFFRNYFKFFNLVF